MKFNQAYIREDFLGFLENFLPEDFNEKEEDIVLNPKRCKEIKQAQILGVCESLNLQVLELEHDNENDPRIAIASDAFKILADHWIHQALVIFRSKNSENYRLSLLTITLDVNEKNKVVKKYSNARRYSFFLGKNAKVRTPEQQLVKKGAVKDADDLFKRFSVEVVNNQFYLEVAKHFDALVSTTGKNLIIPGDAQDDSNIRKSFAVRLIGRIMFCWFLKQKKSADSSLIPEALLSTKAVTDNYYHNTLEPLFFGVLNTSIDSRDIRSDTFDKVPYLNGGLFNPHTEDFYELDKATFTSKHVESLNIKDAWFKDFFELLETYNFTIDENTIFDQELSVDPEMLGRIFENLLAEINPETGNSERKRTGSFYTPRQIVEYMVDQSLVEYFKTKTNIEEKKISALVSYDLTDDTEFPLEKEEKQEVIDSIESLRILDPACGSGAYPIGALQKIVYILQRIDPDCTLWLGKKLKGIPELYRQKIVNEVQSNPFDYTRKLDVIKNSIFGVDIQPIAVDVSRLRCFLTLVVESEVNDTKPNRGIEPLPNLDFKFVCANSLISLPKKENGGLFEDHSGITELAKIMSEYFTCNSQRKNEIKIKFTNIQKEILNKTVAAYGKNTGELTLRLTSWNPFSESTNLWFDPEWMFGLQEKFDVVMGNPPYIKEYTNKSAFDNLRSSPYYQGKTDLWSLFTAISVDYLKGDGTLCFIGPNNWATNAGSSKLRNKVLKETVIRQYIDFGDFKVFEQAGIQTMILVLNRRSPPNTVQVEYLKIVDKGDTAENVYQKMLNDKIFILLVPSEIIDKTITFSTSEFGAVLDKINKRANFILNEKEVAQGIVAAPDKYFLESDLSHYSQNELKYLKKYYTAASKYSPGVSKNYIFYLSEKNFKADSIDQFPNIKKHFEPFKKLLIDAKIRYGTPEKPFYYLHRERDDKFFNQGAKIVCGVRVMEPSFYYTEDEYYGSRALNFIVSDRINLKYLAGILNSKVVYFWLKNRGKQLGDLLQVDKGPLLGIPLFVGTDREQKQIISIVDQIIEIKKQDIDADTKKLESQIDQLVYKLYELSPEEIEIVNNF